MAVVAAVVGADIDVGDVQGDVVVADARSCVVSGGVGALQGGGGLQVSGLAAGEAGASGGHFTDDR